MVQCIAGASCVHLVINAAGKEDKKKQNRTMSILRMMNDECASRFSCLRLADNCRSGRMAAGANKAPTSQQAALK